MILNNKKVFMQPCVSETINNNTVLYIETAQKVIVMNDTATIIWKLISKSIEMDSVLSTEQIAYEICNKYDLDECLLSDVSKDVDDVLETFFKQSLLVRDEHKLYQSVGRIQSEK